MQKYPAASSLSRCLWTRQLVSTAHNAAPYKMVQSYGSEPSSSFSSSAHHLTPVTWANYTILLLITAFFFVLPHSNFINSETFQSVGIFQRNSFADECSLDVFSAEGTQHKAPTDWHSSSDEWKEKVGK